MKNNTIKVNLDDVVLWNYGDYSSDNYGAHSQAVSMGNKTLYFSYNTLVAFKGYNSKGKYFNCCRVNDWGKITGKHLNRIQPDHTKRIERAEFEKMLNEFLK